MAVKAVHIEVVSDYTTAAFLATFKRFTTRRGLCRFLYSDSGTNLQGANAEIRRLFSQTSSLCQEVAAAIAANGIQWPFKPPRAPHFGGLWEAAVRSFKSHFKRAIWESKLTYDEFTTIACSIKACLNYRPPSPTSADAQNPLALTSAHFLIGSSLSRPPEPSNYNSKTSFASRWRLLSFLEKMGSRGTISAATEDQAVVTYSHPEDR